VVCQTGEKRRCWFESSRGSGEIYAYFHCNGRKHDPTSCQFRSVLIHEVERQIDTIYQRITLTAEQRRELEQLKTDAAITKAHLEAALDLLEDCASSYRDAPAHIKKIMNQAQEGPSTQSNSSTRTWATSSAPNPDTRPYGGRHAKSPPKPGGSQTRDTRTNRTPPTLLMSQVFVRSPWWS
jgi:hypothetical protein